MKLVRDYEKEATLINGIEIEPGDIFEEYTVSNQINLCNEKVITKIIRCRTLQLLAVIDWPLR
jgi:hypothetical protein